MITDGSTCSLDEEVEGSRGWRYDSVIGRVVKLLGYTKSLGRETFASKTFVLGSAVDTLTFLPKTGLGPSQNGCMQYGFAHTHPTKPQPSLL